MKKILNIAIIAGLGLSAPTFAHEAGQAGDGYVGDGSGHYITDSAGNCVRSSSWSEDKMTVDCGLEPPAPAPVAAPAPAPAPKVVTQMVSLSGAALFEHDSAVFHRDAQTHLDDFAARVRGMKSIQSINIVGHTDSSGSDAYNQKLSERRAEAVKAFLVERGMDPNTMTTSGMGESQPVADNATKEGRAQNRRVEVTFTGTE